MICQLDKSLLIIVLCICYHLYERNKKKTICYTGNIEVQIKKDRLKQESDPESDTKAKHKFPNNLRAVDYFYFKCKF